MATIQIENWFWIGGLLLIGLLTFAGLWYFFPIYFHQTKFKD